MRGVVNLGLQDIIQLGLDKAISSIYKIRIGKIISFDPAKQLANIELTNKPFKETEDGEIIEYPATLLPDVPYSSFYGGFGRATFPVKVNDYALVYFFDRDIANWYLTGETRIPATNKMHDQNSCYFTLLGIQPQTQLIPNFDNTAIHFESSGGAKIKLSDKVDISNQGQALKQLLESFADAIKGAKVLNPITSAFDLPLDPATISAIDTFKQNVGALLK